MKYSFLTLMWDDSVGEGFIKETNFKDACWVTKMDFLNDVISELEHLRAATIEDYTKPQEPYRF